MRPLYLVILSLHLLFGYPLSAQKNDTTITVTNATQDSVRQLVKKEFERYRDSMEALRIRQNVARNGKSLDAYLQEMQEREKARQRQIYFRIGFAVIFLIILAVGFARRRKKNR